MITTLVSVGLGCWDSILSEGVFASSVLLYAVTVYRLPIRLPAKSALNIKNERMMTSKAHSMIRINSIRTSQTRDLGIHSANIREAGVPHR